MRMLPKIELIQASDRLCLMLTGDWTVANLTSIAWPTLPERTSDQVIEVEAVEIGRLDTSGAWALQRFLLSQETSQTLSQRYQPANANVGVSSADAPKQPKSSDLPEAVLSSIVWRNLTPQYQAVFELVSAHIGQSQASVKPQTRWPLARLGRWSIELRHSVKSVLQFIGGLAVEMGRLIASPSRFRMKEFTNQLEEVLILALPLAFSMMFLLGIVFSYLLGLQAKQYGANIFVVDGSILALCRELSPVIVAILVAGRSGAAMTAQLGTMKVYEEIDAMSVLGLSPTAVLVIPRILALVIALPLLVFVGDVAGILGSMLVAAGQLDITPTVFIHRMEAVFEMKTLLIGLLKAPVFAVFIAIIASYMGLNVARDARSIGLNTTSTVVQSIVAVILLNAVIAITLVELGI